jgi:hypothetical protein
MESRGSSCICPPGISIVVDKWLMQLPLFISSARIVVEIVPISIVFSGERRKSISRDDVIHVLINLVERRLSAGCVDGRTCTLMVNGTVTDIAIVGIWVDLVKRSFSNRARRVKGVGFVDRTIARR